MQPTSSSSPNTHTNINVIHGTRRISTTSASTTSVEYPEPTIQISERTVSSLSSQYQQQQQQHHQQQGEEGIGNLPTLGLINASPLDTQLLHSNTDRIGKVPSPSPPNSHHHSHNPRDSNNRTSNLPIERSISPFSFSITGERKGGRSFLFSPDDEISEREREGEERVGGGVGSQFISSEINQIHPTSQSEENPHHIPLHSLDLPIPSQPTTGSNNHSRTHSFNRSGKSIPSGLSGLLRRIRIERESSENLEREDKGSALSSRSEGSPIPLEMNARDDMTRKERSHRSSGSMSGGLSAPRHGLNALSPLQTLSPLTAPSTSPTATRGGQLGLNIGNVSTSQPPSNTGALPSATSVPYGQLSQSFGSASLTGRQHQRTLSGSSAGGEVRRSRASSVTSKLSRRDSLIARGEGGRDLQSADGSEQGGLAIGVLPSPYMNSRGDGGTSPGGGQSGGLISRLMLVKAPNRNKENQEEEGDNLKRRTKSSSNLVPFSPMAMSSSPSISGGGDMQRNITGRPRTPRAISLVDAYGPASPGGFASSPGRRLSFLFGNNGANSSGPSSNPLNIHEGPKLLSPEEVVSFAESLRSPVLAQDDEDRPPSLSRSSSYRRRGPGTFGGRAAPEPAHEQREEKIPEQLELEPVEYVEMQDDVLLPFVDRPAEVEELFESNPNNKELLEIIRPTFPTISSADPSNPDSWRQVPPASWTWDEFLLHLRENRAECDDLTWVRKLRMAVRAHSEAMWEKIGTCLGCDSDLLRVGDVPDALSSPAPLGDVFDTDDEIATPYDRGGMDSHFLFPDYNVGFDGDDQGRDQVCIQPILPVDKSEDGESDNGRSLPGSFEPSSLMSEDNPLPGAAGTMETIGEEGSGPSSGGRPTPSQVAGGRGDVVDPLLDEYSPVRSNHPLRVASPSPASGRSSRSPHRLRAKSFVGLSINTMPSLPASSGYNQTSSFFPSQIADHPHFERGPGSPLFPTSFSSLSLAPTLPNNNPDLKMSRMSFSFGGALGGTGGGAPRNVRSTMPSGGMHTGGMTRPWMENLKRKKSTGGMSRASDSALTTFESDVGDDITAA